MTSPLTPKQERFVQEYLVDLNATEAAKRAGYSPDSAYSIGWELLKKPEIAAAVAERQLERAARVDVTAEEVLARLEALSSLDIRRIFAADGSLKPLHEIPPEVRLGIASIETEEVYRKDGEGERTARVRINKIRLRDALKATELLAKHLGLLEKKREGEPRLSDLIDRMEEARKRMAAEERKPRPLTMGADGQCGARR